MERIIGLTLLCILVPCSALAAQPVAAPSDNKEFSGMADYYHHSLYGRKTSSGQVLQKHLLTAAHRTLPFGTLVHVKNHRNGRSCVVVINDRGPFTKSKVIDLSHQAATELNMISAGTVKVGCTVIDKTKMASLQAKTPVEPAATTLLAVKPAIVIASAKPSSGISPVKTVAIRHTAPVVAKNEMTDEPAEQNRIMWTTDQ